MRLKNTIWLANILTIGLLISTMACIESEDVGIYEGNVQLFNNNQTFQDANTARKNGHGHTLSDPFEIKGVEREDDSLKVTVGYSGGCQIHNFNVIWDGIITASNPCQINLIIDHDANGDHCEAYFVETLVIDLNQLIGEGDEKDSCVYNIFTMTNETDVPNASATTN
jgi:hypothetical protein